MRGSAPKELQGGQPQHVSCTGTLLLGVPAPCWGTDALLAPACTGTLMGVPVPCLGTLGTFALVP